MAVKKTLAIAGISAALFLLSLFSINLEAQTPTLSLLEGSVWVKGIDPEVLYTFNRYFNSQEDWESVFPVTVRENPTGIVVSGTYKVFHDAIMFTPRFPFAAKVKYTARFNTRELADNRNEVYLPMMNDSPLELNFSIDGSGTKPATVLAIYPTADVLPENLLKFHICFSESMTLGEAYQRISLEDEKGKEIEKPFLILDQELWDGDMKVFTLLLDPGRIKRGLRPNLEMKPALHEKNRYALVIKKGWKDINGNFTDEEVVKWFSCSAADRESPVVSHFVVATPTSEKGALVINLRESMNYVLLTESVRIFDSRGQRVEGSLVARQNESVLEFVPKHPWFERHYTIQFNPLLEDLAGNNFNRLFDEDKSSPDRQDQLSTKLSFLIANTPR
ncbi:MAG TPA: hypothetical protein VGD65_05575 [Chryseosolibacter sp.]